MISPFLVLTIFKLTIIITLCQLSTLPYPFPVCLPDSLNLSQSPCIHTGRFSEPWNCPTIGWTVLIHPKFSPLSWSLAMAVGNTAYFPPSAPGPVRTWPGPSCQVLDCNSQEQALCLVCRCPSSASQGRKSMFPALLSLTHTDKLNKTALYPRPETMGSLIQLSYSTFTEHLKGKQAELVSCLFGNLSSRMAYR